MSETKFQVGQWVTCDTRIGVFRVAETHHGGTLRVDLAGVGWSPQNIWKPFRWEIGRTYRTTLDRVTVRVLSVDLGIVRCKWSGPVPCFGAAIFSQTTGLMPGFETRDDVPHLLPYIADESPPVADIGPQSAAPSSVHRVEAQSREAKRLLIDDACANEEACAEFSEFEDAGYIGPQSVSQSSAENKINGVYCCDIVQNFNFNIGSAIASLWTCDVGTSGSEAINSLKAAVWYVQREIERRERSEKNGEQK